MKRTNKWLPFGYRQSCRLPLRVFCFHYAGGSASVYKEWAALSRAAEFIPVELPGRGTRISEACIEQFDYLIDVLIDDLHPIFRQQPFCFFGHSMGAAIAFEAACRLEAEFNMRPDKLIVAGRQAPQCPDPSRFRSDMDDEALVAELRRLNGTPQVILDNVEILQFLLPIIRSDYRLHESYCYREQKIGIPIIAHAGRHDSEATTDIMQHWAHVTNDCFALGHFDGGHFFVQALGEFYLSRLLEAIGA